MPNFIPVDSEKSDDLKRRLSESPFQNPKTFIDMFNEGIINRKNEKVVAFSNELKETYRDVKEKSGKLVFITQEEIFLEEISDEIANWIVVEKIRRELQSLKKSKVVDDNDIIAFSTAQLGFICRLTHDEIQKLSGERLFNSISKLQNLHTRYSSQNIVNELGEKVSEIPAVSTDATSEISGEDIDDSSTANTENDELFYEFRVSDFINLDDSFIAKIYEIIPK